jgi:KipI family sensor histidine kinase inhibitor
MAESGLLITWRGPKEVAGTAIRELQGRIAERPPDGIVEVVPGLESLLVCYDPLHASAEQFGVEIERRLPDALQGDRALGEIIEIEVAYGGADGPDLAYVARACGLAEAEVIVLHTARPMPVLMIGFMPGFPYIGALPPELRLPRRAEPRTSVPAGSVAIANDQTGIYPSRSPGGWHIIGHTSADLFDPHREAPALLRAGDQVRFVARRRE